MDLKGKVLIIYTVTIISLPAGGRSEPLGLHNVRNRGRQLHPRQADQGWRNPAVSEETRAHASERRPGSVSSSSKASHEACGRGEIQELIHGDFYVLGQLELNVRSADVRSGSAVSGHAIRTKGQQVRGPQASWQGLHPVVECGEDAMTLTVRKRRAVQLHLNQVNDSSVPLSQLPLQCGYSVQTTWRDLSLVVQYNACHVLQEDDRYVLPLLWKGTPAKISCPVSQIQPRHPSLSSLCCSQYSMTVRVLSAAEELRVNMRGEWPPLVVLAEQCGYTLDRRDAEVIITAPFLTCGITLKGGKHTLSFQVGGKTFTLSCPISPHEELQQTQQSLVDISNDQTRDLAEPMPESLVPPFHLAPLYYPHPTYRPKYPRPYVHDAFNPSTSEPTVGPQPLPDSQDYSPLHVPIQQSSEHFGVHRFLSPRDEMEDSSQLYPDLQQNNVNSVSGLPERGSVSEASSLQPPSHTFNPYYHYYHLPKIPLPGPPLNPYPGTEGNDGFPVLPLNVHEFVNSDQIPQPERETFQTRPKFVHKAHEPRAPYRHHYSFVAGGEAKTLTSLHPDAAAQASVSTIHPLPHKYNTNPFLDHSNEAINQANYPPHWIKHLLFSEDDKMRTVPETPTLPSHPPGLDSAAAAPPEQPPFLPPSSSHNPPPYPFDFHPYYPYYLLYYGPEASLSSDNQPSDQYQTSTPPIKPLYDQNPPLNPFYYYYQPVLPVDEQQLHPAAIVDSGVAESKSEHQFPFGSSRMNTLAPADEAEYIIIPQPLYSPFNLFSSQYVTLQHPCDSFGAATGEAGRLEAGTPSAAPCGLGPVSNFDCSNPWGCCWYPVKECTMGQYFVFAVPDSVLELSALPPTHPFENTNVPCTLEKLASDPDIYIVPLDGCGVSKHTFGQTVVYLLEVHGIHSHPQGSPSVYGNTPVRLMVECSSFRGSPGEVRLHVMDPPLVQSATATITVQLKIATDQTFTSFHPEAHLPLSLLQGRPLYLEVSLVDPPQPELVLLVHSCLAYTQAPYSSWVLVYDGCNSQSNSQQLPSPHSHPHHIRRLVVPSFLSWLSESTSDMVKAGSPRLEDPEIYFLCLTEVCSAAGGGCTVSCINSPNSDV